MASPYTAVITPLVKQLQARGAVMIRQNGHQHWRLGKYHFTLAPSRAHHNVRNLAVTLKRLLNTWDHEHPVARVNPRGMKPSDVDTMQPFHPTVPLPEPPPAPVVVPAALMVPTGTPVTRARVTKTCLIAGCQFMTGWPAAMGMHTKHKHGVMSHHPARVAAVGKRGSPPSTFLPTGPVSLGVSEIVQQIKAQMNGSATWQILELLDRLPPYTANLETEIRVQRQRFVELESTLTNIGSMVSRLQRSPTERL